MSFELRSPEKMIDPMLRGGHLAAAAPVLHYLQIIPHRDLSETLGLTPSRVERNKRCDSKPC